MKPDIFANHKLTICNQLTDAQYILNVNLHHSSTYRQLCIKTFCLAYIADCKYSRIKLSIRRGKFMAVALKDGHTYIHTYTCTWIPRRYVWYH